MAGDLIPSEVRDFLLRHIDSIAQLEALLLLRAQAEITWSAEMLAKRLYISTQETAEILARLCADRFLVALGGESPQYQYHCPARAQADMVDRVADLYAHYLIPITHLIHSKPRTRVQAFADAFKLRRGE